ncbi:MAG: hypothetical protein JXB18_01510 [Sedimentisphaerales bacterium]|nr:hypothetical protein [Sedimentisphaerales bacterium]
MDEHCAGCGHQDTCKEAYQIAGQSQGPNITWKAIQAFVLPVAVFVCAAGIAQPWLKNKIENPKLLTVALLSMGLVAASVAIFGIRYLTRHKSGQSRCPK